MVVCDKWIAVKILEVIFCISCVICKRVTDDESVRVSLYLQKISREWSLLRNITWSSVGSSFADAVYGGYLIITFGLLLGWLFNEVPRGKRVLEGFLLGIGALFFVILGALELASLDSIPDRLIDNAAVLGVLSLVTAVLFLIDLAGARNRDTDLVQNKTSPERRSFKYPTLPRENVDDVRIESGDQKKILKGDKLIDKNKKEPVVKNNEKKPDQPPTMPSTAQAPSSQPKDKDTDEVDNFMSSQVNGYHRFDRAQNESGAPFEEIERTKYGSVRNGVLKSAMETENFQRSASSHGRYRSPPAEKEENSVYEVEMSKNMAYLRRVEDNNRPKYALTNGYNNNNNNDPSFIAEYKQRMSLPTTHQNHDREDHQRRWETFERDTLPPFPVKEDYLPELQMPVFAKIKESKLGKNYGIYDNYSNLNIDGRKAEASQTDSLRSKMSTLKSKAPTLQQIAEYFGLEHKQQQQQQHNSKRVERREAGSQVYKDDIPAVSFMLPKNRSEAIECNGEPVSPTDPGYVQYTAQHWNEKHNYKYSTRTPRHSPADA